MQFQEHPIRWWRGDERGMCLGRVADRFVVDPGGAAPHGELAGGDDFGGNRDVHVEAVVTEQVEVLRGGRPGYEMQPPIVFEHLHRVDPGRAVLANRGEVGDRSHLLVVQTGSQQTGEIGRLVGELRPRAGTGLLGQGHERFLQG